MHPTVKYLDLFGSEVWGRIMVMGFSLFSKRARYSMMNCFGKFRTMLLQSVFQMTNKYLKRMDNDVNYHRAKAMQKLMVGNGIRPTSPLWETGQYLSV